MSSPSNLGASPSPVGAAIVGTGSAVPGQVLSNSDLERSLDTSDEWIIRRTGIRERRIAGDGETTASLGAQAARNALLDANLDANQIDVIICATVSPEMLYPATSCFIQSAINAPHVPAFDVGAACSGFLYALDIAAKFVKSGQYRRALVIGAETMSRITDYQDRSTCILFGDGAGAVILAADPDPGRGVVRSRLYADGNRWELAVCKGGGSRHPASRETVEQRLHYTRLKGREVYRFAVDKMQELIKQALVDCSVTLDGIDLVVPHQVNRRILDTASERLGLAPEKIFVNLDRYGNTSAASIPLALDEARRQGRIGAGGLALLVAFGAGLTWASCVVRL